MNNAYDKENLLRKKADAFCLLGNLVHITYIENGGWKNGIIKQVKKDYFILDERLQGSILVFFAEINDIREFTKDE